MAISFACGCGFVVRAPDTSAGRRGRCPSCKRPVTVPSPVTDDAIDRAGLTVSGAAGDGGIPLADAPAAAKPRPTPERSPASAASPTRSPASGSHAVARTEAPRRVGVRRHLYWVLLLVLLPLGWSILHATPNEKHTLSARLERTLAAHPELTPKLENLSDDASLRDLCDVLPGDRIDGQALLPERTHLHWAFAAVSAGVFLASALLLFPAGHTRVTHLLGVGVLTGTLGIVLLLAFQWLAFHMPLFRGRGAITLLLDLVWLIGQSYRMALGEHGFWLSFLGFTAGVGFCEEACKALPLLVKANGTGFSGWRSAMLWGLISGIGFGVSEGVTYSVDYYNGISGAEDYVVRFVSCVGLHGIWSAAVAITIFRRQTHFAAVSNFFEWLLQVLLAVLVPMVLHGLYDTLLKQDYDVWALVVALASFGWLAYQIERTTRSHGEPEALPA